MRQGTAPRFTLSHVSLILVGLMWVLPFLYHLHTYPLPSFYQEVIAAALGLAALTLLLRARYWQVPQIPRIALVPMALAGILVVQLALDLPAYPEQGLLALLYLLFFMFLMVLGRVLREELGRERLVTGLAWFLLAGAVLSAEISLLQYYNVQGIWDDLIADRMVGIYAGNLGQANHFSDYTALGLASVLYLFASGRLGSVMATLLAAMLLYVLGLSGSRSSWLYLGAFAALAALSYGQRRGVPQGHFLRGAPQSPDPPGGLRSERGTFTTSGDFAFGAGYFLRGAAASRRLLLASVLLVPAFGLAQFLATLPWLTPEAPQITATQRLYELASGFGIRLELWREAWEMFLSAPLLGTGFGQFGWQHFQGTQQARVPEMQLLYHHAHNLVLQLLAEMGIFAAALVLIGAGAWAWCFARTAPQSPEGTFTTSGDFASGAGHFLRGAPHGHFLRGAPQGYFLRGAPQGYFLRGADPDLGRWWMLAVLAVLAIHSLLEFPLWYAYFIGIAAVLLGAGESRVLRLNLGGVGRWMLAGMLLLGVATTYNLAADYHQLRYVLRMSRAALDPDQGARQLNQALLEIHRGSLLAPYVELMYVRSAELDPGALDSKLFLSTQAMRFLPLPDVAYRHAMFLAMAGRQDAALDQLHKAVAAYGGHLPGALKELENLARGDPARYRRLLESARLHLKEQGSGVHPE